MLKDLFGIGKESRPVKANLPFPGAGRLLGARPLQHRKVATLGGSSARAPIPGAGRLLGARPLQYGQVTAQSRVAASPLFPGAAQGACALQRLQVAASRRHFAAERAGIVQLCQRPPQHGEVAMEGGARSCAFPLPLLQRPCHTTRWLASAPSCRRGTRS